jgi:hydroxyethylthiazole kinase-like uncharacterized protein yjeF
VIEAWSTSDVYAAEGALMATLVEGELMARAVSGIAAVAAARLEGRQGTRVVALVGGGNNGADALYAAARLAEAGYSAAAVRRSSGVHEGALAAAEAAGVLLCVDDDPAGLERIAEADVVLDGVFGIGGRSGLPDWARPWVDAVGEDTYLIAVDVPSGQDPAGHELSPDGVFADETVTFSVAKPVHLLPPTEQAVGRLTVVDIGLEIDSTPAVRRLTHDDVADLWPVPTATDDKYSRGVLGVIAGGEGYTGAPVLACTAAVEAGVGMVRYVGTPQPEALVRSLVPEAVHGVGRVQAWAIGSGLDVEATGEAAERQVAAARDALASDLPVLLDAGGLDLLEGPRAAPTLLTPHAGEAARLITRLMTADPHPVHYLDHDITRAHVEAEPYLHARRLAELTGATVLLKGATTVVAPADLGEPVWSQADAPAWLATAGAGDVLAGLAGALLAAGLAPDLAGALAALVHGVAADRANPGGPVRALAVAHGIPAAVAHLLARR